jgi:hypothetical protein
VFTVNVGDTLWIKKAEVTSDNKNIVIEFRNTNTDATTGDVTVPVYEARYNVTAGQLVQFGQLVDGATSHDLSCAVFKWGREGIAIGFIVGVSGDQVIFTNENRNVIRLAKNGSSYFSLSEALYRSESSNHCAFKSVKIQKSTNTAYDFRGIVFDC